VNGADDRRRPLRSEWYGHVADDEYLRLRLIAMLDEVSGAIARLRRSPEGEHEQTVAVLERLRADLVAAVQLAVDHASREG